ncbi:MAG: hypothetical protein GDA48_23085 [Hormoscilla sp. GM102CHS1]|nr:hypothetical protein [Hormoscilla sp. GM102CHS1]
MNPRRADSEEREFQANKCSNLFDKLYKELLRFAGTISHEDAKLMGEAIEENCGQADLKTWSD